MYFESDVYYLENNNFYCSTKNSDMYRISLADETEHFLFFIIYLMDYIFSQINTFIFIQRSMN